jgi:phosphoglycolate phosphatase-like HAD superfamily hydrolase
VRGTHGAARRLLLFDIDGTLVLTGGAGQDAMAAAVKDVFGFEDALDGVQLAGRTDRAILEDALASRAGRPVPLDGKYDAFRAAYFRHLAREIEVERPRKRALPGVHALLDALAARGEAALGLLTGNFRESAEIKLAHFDLWRYFSWGAFGSETRDRNALFPVAMREAATRGFAAASPRDVVIIGDTPHDIFVAHAGRALAVGVATGQHSVADLDAAGADVVFEDLSDTGAVLAALLDQ